MSERLSREVAIVNRLGLHARPAMEFVDCACGFKAEVRVRRADGQEWVNGKSIMEMMLLAATRGTRLVLEVAGEDQEKAMTTLAKLVADGFNED